MKSILKKNQIIISAIAVMLIAAGYMSYTTKEKTALQTAALADTEQYAELGDATLVSANVETEEKQPTEESNIIENNISQNREQTINTNSQTTENQYFAESRLEREKMYSQMLESYEKILSNSQISDAQKEISENEIKNINDTKNSIMITENLIKNKGFEDLVIFINGDSISIIIKAKELSEEQIAQIQNIVTRELKTDIENIHISCKE